VVYIKRCDGVEILTQKISWLLTLSLEIKVLYALCDGTVMRRGHGADRADPDLATAGRKIFPGER
jgi:hypothetical protein